MIERQPLDVWAIAAVLLFLKMLALAIYQGRHRIPARVFTNPEDARVFGDGVAATEDLPAVARAQRALRNDLENIPMFLILSFAYLLYDAWEQGAYAYIGAFVLARIVHSWAYVREKQPLRTVAYSIGVLCSLLVSAHLVHAILLR